MTRGSQRIVNLAAGFVDSVADVALVRRESH